MQKTMKKMTLFSVKEVRQILTMLAVLAAVMFVSYFMGKRNYEAYLQAEADRLVQESLEAESRQAKLESQLAAYESAEAAARAEAESMAAAGIRQSPFVGATNDAGQAIYKVKYESGKGDCAELEVDENCEVDYSQVLDIYNGYEKYDGFLNFCYPLNLYNNVEYVHEEKIMDIYEAVKFSNGNDNRLVMEFRNARNYEFKEILSNLFKQVKADFGIEPEITSQEIVQYESGELYWKYETETIIARGMIRGLRSGGCAIVTVICPAPTDSEDALYKNFYMDSVINLATLSSKTGSTLTWEAYKEQQQ